VTTLARASMALDAPDTAPGISDINRELDTGVLETDRGNELNRLLESFSSDDLVQPPRLTDGENKIDEATALDGSSAKEESEQKEDLQTHLLPDVELLIEFSMRILDDGNESLAEEREVPEWGWSLVVSALSEPHLKLQDTVGLGRVSTEDLSFVTTERDINLQELRDSIKEKKEIPLKENNFDDDTFFIPAVEGLCSDESTFELFSAFSEACTGEEGATKKQMVLMNSHPPRETLKCLTSVSARGASSDDSAPLNCFEYSYLAHLLETVMRKGKLMKTKKLSVPCADSLSFHIESLVSSPEPDFVDVLTSMSARFNWKTYERQTAPSSNVVFPYNLHTLHENDFHVLHMCYYNIAGGQLTSCLSFLRNICYLHALLVQNLGSDYVLRAV
jgi:hypothetical protein